MAVAKKAKAKAKRVVKRIDGHPFKELSKYKSKDPLLLSYIPILDRNPKYAARYLTKTDLIDSYNLLKEVFREIEEDNIKHEILADTILYCHENFYWYNIFIKEATNILREESIKVPCRKCPDFKLGEHTLFQHPFGVYYDAKRKNYFVEELSSNKETNDEVNNYRIKYIIDQHELSEFLGDGYPAWYSLQNLTIYEDYCTKTNTRIRIDFKDGSLHYFIAGASDNWKEIENVPYNMIYIIFALLFRNPMRGLYKIFEKED